jgi:hypothetical protein
LPVVETNPLVLILPPVTLPTVFTPPVEQQQSTLDELSGERKAMRGERT